MSPSRTITLLISSLSARGASLGTGRRVADTLRGGGWLVHEVVTTSRDDVAKVSAAAQTEFVGAVGGDGYLGRALSAQTGGTVFVPFPGGRGNDLCRSLGIGADPHRFARKISVASLQELHSWVRPLDGMRVDDGSGPKFVFGIVSLGIGATATLLANQSSVKSGSLSYMWGAVQGFLGKFKPKPVTALIDGDERDIGGWLTAVSNTGWFGGGINIVPASRTDDGILEVVSVARVSRARALPLLMSALVGRGVEHPLIKVEPAFEVELLEPTSLPVFADGDVIGHLPMSVTVVEGAFQVVAPAA